MGINGCMTENQTDLRCEQLSRYCSSALYSYMLVSICLTVHCNYTWFWPRRTEKMSDYTSIV